MTYLTAEDFLDYYNKMDNPTPELKKIAENMKEDDNPIVIIGNLKNE